jgi:hypothetical protein
MLSESATRALSTWRVGLMGMSVLLGVSVAALPSTAQTGFPNGGGSTVRNHAQRPVPWYLVPIRADSRHWYSRAKNLRAIVPRSDRACIGLNDNSVASIKIGSGVRVQLYANTEFDNDADFANSGHLDSPFVLEPNDNRDDVGSFISSMRVDPVDRSFNCVPQSGEIGLFRLRSDGTISDCIAVPDVIWTNAFTARPNQFSATQYIGIKNDSINAIDLTRTKCGVELFNDAYFNDKNPKFLGPGGPGQIYHAKEIGSVAGHITSIRVVPNSNCPPPVYTISTLPPGVFANN